MKLLQILILVSVVNADQFFNNFTICGKPIKKRTMESSNYVSPGYFPWQAAVKKTVISNFNGLPDCGATLISNEWLVSAAHCNITVGDHVVLGANYIGLSVEESRQYFRVKFVRPHPSYSKVTNDYDIALVQLDKPATYTDYVRPACIINSGTKLAAATKSEVSGWGLLKCGGPENLQKGEISISSNDVCNQIYGNKEVTPRMLCAKHPAGGREGCLGDGGGPLVVDVKQNQQFYLAGVVSWGTKCRHGFPEVFANVSTLREWLQEELKSKKGYFLSGIFRKSSKDKI
ncbi:chymotrypsinogen B-like [Clytia hemisphaerica]|uniref:chymotrypsinogen B-like n=1 Tax=Clytia hemisphaerica TaxID=252671 RepID=UPI0034D47FD5